MRGVLRRVRAFGGQFALLAVLAALAGLLVTGAPRLANDRADEALRRDVGRVPSLGRDIVLRQSFTPSDRDFGGSDPLSAAAYLDTLRNGLKGPLPGLVGQQWFTGAVGPGALAGRVPVGREADIGLRVQDGAAESATVTAGRWPRTSGSGSRAEVAVSAAVARTLGLRVGTVVRLRGQPPPFPGLEMVVVGLFTPVDPTAPAWDGAELALRVHTVPGVADRAVQALALTDPVGLARAAISADQAAYTWRYRLDPARLDAASLDPVVTAITETKGAPPAPRTAVATALDAALADFAGQLRAVRALLAVVQAGLLATLVGLAGLAAGLAVDRRREEFTLLRARGAATVTVGLRTAAESIVVLPAAVLAGAGLGALAPGRPAPTAWLVPAIAVGATLAMPVLATAGHRRLAFVARRRDLVTRRPSARRLTAEAFVLTVAALGAFLIRRRGLPGGEVDAYLVSVPVLLATGAALLALRVFPWPLRRLGGLAGRARGAVPFLGLAGAARGAWLAAGPLVVLVLAVATGVFCGAVTTSVADARDRAAERAVPADRMVRGGYVTAGTTARFAAVPGVTRVAPMAVEAGTTVRAGGASTGRVQVVVVDGAALADVGRRSRTGVHLPAVVAQARRAGPVRAVLSPDVAADLRLATGGAGEALVRGRPYDFTAGAVVADFPGVAGRFVVLPWQALAPDDAEWVLPNTFLIAGRADPAALRAVALAGEREAGRGAAAVPPTVLTREAYRQGLDRTGANDVLSVAYGVGALGGTALALLTVAFLVLGGAPGRARSLSRLRTMGLSPRQGRALLAYEVAPLLLLAVLVGGVVGVLLPMALGPALGLSLFTAGVPARVRVDPWLVAAVLGLVAVAVLVALAVENLANRRLRLGAVLRVGEG